MPSSTWSVLGRVYAKTRVRAVFAFLRCPLKARVPPSRPSGCAASFRAFVWLQGVEGRKPEGPARIAQLDASESVPGQVCEVAWGNPEQLGWIWEVKGPRMTTLLDLRQQGLEFHVTRYRTPCWSVP